MNIVHFLNTMYYKQTTENNAASHTKLVQALPLSCQQEGGARGILSRQHFARGGTSDSIFRSS